MVFFVAPIAVVGYRLYMQKKAERESREHLDEPDDGHALATESTTQDDEVSDSPQDHIHKEPVDFVNPMEKFRSFCKNLESRRKEAEQKILQQFVKEAMRDDERKTENVHTSATLTADPPCIADSLEIPGSHGGSELPSQVTDEIISSMASIGECGGSDLPVHVTGEITNDVRSDFPMKRRHSAPPRTSSPILSLYDVSGSGIARTNRLRIASI